MNFSKPTKLLTLLFSTLLFVLSGCTSVASVHPNAKALSKYNVASGRVVGVVHPSGETMHLKVISVSGKSITGHKRDGSKIEIPSNEIHHIKVKHYDGPKTLGAVVGGALAAYLSAAAIFIHIWDFEH